MTYSSFLLNAIVDNAFTNKHHIIPRSVGGSNDPDNIITLTPAQHAYAHYLFDRENGTNTFRFFAHKLGIKDNTKVTYEDCLPLNMLDEERANHVSEALKESWKDEEKNIIRREKMSKAKTGKVNVCVNTIWVTNGTIRKRVPANRIPEGFKKGMKHVVQD